MGVLQTTARPPALLAAQTIAYARAWTVLVGTGLCVARLGFGPSSAFGTIGRGLVIAFLVEVVLSIAIAVWLRRGRDASQVSPPVSFGA